MYILPSAATAMIANAGPGLSTREALSGAFGSISISCWIFLMIPQLVENYRNQSAEAISLLFVIIWFVGDVANLLGGLWAGLVSTAIALAVWFVVIDVALVSQCLYYGIRNRRREGKSWLAAARESISAPPEVGHAENGNAVGDQAAATAEAVRSVHRQRQQEPVPEQAVDEEEEDGDEEQPLLKRTASITAQNRKPLSRPTPAQRRSSINAQMIQRRRSSMASVPIVRMLEERDSMTDARLWLRNVISIFGVFVVGAVGWALAYQSGLWEPQPLDGGDGGEPVAKGAQVLGYISAVAYLGARIPQIIKNWREQSCEGLSLLFFILSLCGNLTYGASLLFHATDHDNVMKNLPWLIGSLGTMVEDTIIFFQFRIYGNNDNNNDNNNKNNSSSNYNTVSTTIETSNRPVE